MLSTLLEALALTLVEFYNRACDLYLPYSWDQNLPYAWLDLFFYNLGNWPWA